MATHHEDGEPSPDSQESQTTSQDGDDSPETQQLARRRSYLAELQRTLTELQAQYTAKMDSTEVRRAVQTTDSFGRLAKSFSVAFRDKRFATQCRPMLEEERRRVTEVIELQERLKQARIRQRSLRLDLDKVRGELQKPGRAKRHLLEIQRDPAVLQEYGLLVAEHASVVREYELTSKVLMASNANWLGLDGWMENVRPRYHALRPPQDVFRGSGGTETDVSESDADALESDGAGE